MTKDAKHRLLSKLEQMAEELFEEELGEADLDSIEL